MNKQRVPKRRDEFENSLVSAFCLGMQCGYSVEHTELSNDEKVLENRYRALVQGKINSMSEIYNEEKLYCEKIMEMEINV